MNGHDELVLKINNLSIDFAQQNKTANKVLKNISFEIPTSYIVAMVGESGSGKSVTGLSVMGLLPTPTAKITSGEILFFKNLNQPIDLLKLNDKEKNKYRGNYISMIFQEPMTSLNPVMKCGEQVVEVILKHKPDDIKTKKQAKIKTLDLFKEVELTYPQRIFNSYPHEISGGQKQRVMIAMAIACKPRLLIADEPTTALDITIQKTILELLKKLQVSYGMSILFITHDLSIVADIADKVIIMYKGQIVEEGPTYEIFNNPVHLYTKGLLACRPPLNKRYLLLPTVSDYINNDETKLFDSLQEIKASERVANHKLLYSNEPILKVENLQTQFKLKSSSLVKIKKSYFKAIDNISFEIYPGETLGLVGESGCGKTTLGRSILMLVKPFSGKIIYKGRDLKTLAKHELRNIRKEIQIVFQDPYSSLNPRLTIGKAIMEPMIVHNLYGSFKEQKKRAIYLLERVGLSEYHFNYYPHEFSGGQRQRICIARALALNPQIIICDEAVSALDVSVQAQVLNLLNELKKDFRFTYLFISHDLSVVRYMSDRIMVMYKGKIIEINEADHLFNNPSNNYTKKLIYSIPTSNLQ
ncbi:MAG TPA: ABC transporter ATP-binding protein [Bacteroidales bacterium]|nr:ABC transporter ATP-binding protein [Bacteroidales bacterium]